MGDLQRSSYENRYPGSLIPSCHKPGHQERGLSAHRKCKVGLLGKPSEKRKFSPQKVKSNFGAMRTVSVGVDKAAIGSGAVTTKGRISRRYARESCMQ